MKSKELSQYLNDLLDVFKIQDASLNGLQVENQRDVRKIGFAVDISQAVLEKACDLNVDFLLVHHGLFWGNAEAVTGRLYQRIRILIQNDIALYAVHLPLDVHPRFGNNAQIQQALGWPVKDDFGQFQNMPLGKEIRFKQPKLLSEVMDDLQRGLGCEPEVWNFGSASVQRLGFISGGGVGFLDQAVNAGLDTLVTGEPRHSAYWEAKEAEINVIFAGHYATETLGVRAVGEHLQKKFSIETVFIDLPTGY
jgi:dinuclear metal center YbgI/SA1388 family protein